MASIQYSLRPYRPPGSGTPSSDSLPLEAGFRLYLTSIDLVQLKLRPGQLCEVKSGSGSCIGVAWKSTEPDTNNQARNAKVPDTFRAFYGLQLKDKVSLSGYDGTLPLASEVTISDAKGTSGSKDRDDQEDWDGLAYCALQGIDAICQNGTFDAVVRRGENQSMKRTFKITHIQHDSEGVGSNESELSTRLFGVNSKTKVRFQAHGAPRRFGTRAATASFRDIAGLDHQLQEMKEFLDIPSQPVRAGARNTDLNAYKTLLVYGAEGTGKSLVLNALLTQVDRVKRLHDLSGTARSVTLLETAFQDALRDQPSFIVVDDIDELLGKSDQSSGPLIAVLARNLDSLDGSQVAFVATAITPNNIPAKLRRRFAAEIELPIPDATARAQILNKLIGDRARIEPNVLSVVALRSHGYVGSDLRFVASRAYRHFRSRQSQQEPIASEDQATKDDSINGDLAEISSPLASLSLTSLSLEDFSHALSRVHPSALKELFIETPQVQWTDIGGYATIKRKLYDATTRVISDPELMLRLTVRPPRGILLYGPPGCSKTLTARAAATASGFSFIAIKGAQLINMYVGETERAIREVFRKARAAAPTIIFFDEIDAIAVSREGGGGGSSGAVSGLNTVTTLLNEMDGIEELRGVLVLAATNRPDVLDKALLRPGRFSQLLYVGPPDEEARLQILQIRTKKTPLAADVDLKELTLRLEGYTGAEVVNVVDAACDKAYTECREKSGAEEVASRHFDDALKEVHASLTSEAEALYREWALDTERKL
ncbi:AAA-domain-containing protein [Eremomyces bilateralis CBS 781.70]|uniref:AAA-domain-containing protein n=1 Tax=Eremomyces bilateralis CBS 781.70 TaxID=1392243 RepID=A0A6G1GA08_9PEZI|nr:AAA-domain-containing protein [Eremomyces bilateralis CBS 781.70]KAF1814689.1 AAA-domain-containing protein [Eremomyces bilateralis CBS 781.70]